MTRAARPSAASHFTVQVPASPRANPTTQTTQTKEPPQ